VYKRQVEKIAKIEDGGQASRAANDVPVLSRGRLGDAEEKDDHGDEEGDSFHNLQPLRGSPTSGLLARLARNVSLRVSKGRLFEPMVRACLFA